MKKWWKSRTLWVNAIALAALFLQEATGEQVLSAEVQLGILALVNTVLRFDTNAGIWPVTAKPVE